MTAKFVTAAHSIMDTMKNTTIPIEIYEDGTVLKDIIQAKLSDSEKGEYDDPFYVADLGEVVSQYIKWTELIPRVKPFYAMKSNPNRAMLKVLAALGTGFDCASKGELITVLDLNVAPSDIIYAHTCKQESHLRFAKQKDISLMTFDNEDELLKISRVYPEARLVLRLAIEDSSAVVKLSSKYGCELKQAPHLLQVAKQTDLNVVGVSFHVGSSSQDPNIFKKAIEAARQVFDQAQSDGFQMNVLDIGGGFPGPIVDGITTPFKKFADVINKALEQYFPMSTYSFLRIISEPGRYFAEPVFTIVLNVVARHCLDYQRTHYIEATSEHKSTAFKYYLNDGVYGSFFGVFAKQMPLTPSILKDRDIEELKFSSSFWGQTCCSFDCINKQCCMPKLEVGEWVYFEAFGAYTLSINSNFNGFNAPHCYYVAPKQISSLLQEVFEVTHQSDK